MKEFCKNCGEETYVPKNYKGKNPTCRKCRKNRFSRLLALMEFEDGLFFARNVAPYLSLRVMRCLLNTCRAGRRVYHLVSDTVKTAWIVRAKRLGFVVEQIPISEESRRFSHRDSNFGVYSYTGGLFISVNNGYYLLYGIQTKEGYSGVHIENFDLNLYADSRRLQWTFQETQKHLVFTQNHASVIAIVPKDLKNAPSVYRPLKYDRPGGNTIKLVKTFGEKVLMKVTPFDCLKCLEYDKRVKSFFEFLCPWWDWTFNVVNNCLYTVWRDYDSKTWFFKFYNRENVSLSKPDKSLVLEEWKIPFKITLNDRHHNRLFFFYAEATDHWIFLSEGIGYALVDDEFVPAFFLEKIDVPQTVTMSKDKKKWIFSSRGLEEKDVFIDWGSISESRIVRTFEMQINLGITDTWPVSEIAKLDGITSERIFEGYCEGKNHDFFKIRPNDPLYPKNMSTDGTISRNFTGCVVRIS